MEVKLIRGLHNMASATKGGVITIGNFDGVHLAHQALIAKVKAKARLLSAPASVMTFEPQPFEYFSPTACAPRLTRWREKYCLLAKQGIDQVIAVYFTKAFSALTAEQFVQRVLCDGLAVKGVIVGDDFRFGQARQGDVDFLRDAGKRYGFEVEIVPAITLDQERISSTRIRQALADKDHELADRMLGRPYTMVGRVVHGNKQGRIMGFPTANIYLHRRASPVNGVYIVRMGGLGDKLIPGVANVGIRPTIGGTQILLEVHLFHFNQDIYGRQVTVEFCTKLRDEEYYSSIEELVVQIGRDADMACDYFKARGEL